MTVQECNQLPLKDRISLNIKYSKWYKEKRMIRKRDMKHLPARKKKIDRFEVWLERVKDD